MNGAKSVAELQLRHRFEEIRRQLLDQQGPETAPRASQRRNGRAKPTNGKIHRAAIEREGLDRPLAFWAVPNDRRLPLKFMDRPVSEILGTPFEELCDTPGVGAKKIVSLLDLLHRVAAGEPSEPESNNSPALDELLPGEAGFNPAAVSESTWEKWRRTVRQFGLGREPLGRLAPSLQQLTRVVWHTPLSAYCNLTLAEIRDLKTHGEKRVRAVIEVFGAVQSMLGERCPSPHLAVKLYPRFVDPVAAGLAAACNDERTPSRGEILSFFVQPLLEQVNVDCGEMVARLAAGRLNLKGDGVSVRQAASKLGLTRARVYQILGDVSAMMQVRWPEGESLVSRLRDRLETERPGASETRLFLEAAELFYPTRQAGSRLTGRIAS